MAAWINRMRRHFGRFSMETSYVAEVYADSLRDNFVGFTPTDINKFEALKSEFDDVINSGFEGGVVKEQSRLANLLKIEAALLEVVPDDMMMSRLWAVEDRFSRVVPVGTRQRYEASVPPKGVTKWEDTIFVRNQMRTMLDVIHTNYLINISREQSVKRLIVIIALAFLTVITFNLCGTIIIMIRADWLKSSIMQPLELLGYMALFVAGVFGAVLSVLDRLQKVVSRDAMTEDGIFELTGLRSGWVGIVASFFAGGGFALVLYWVVMAGLLNGALPTPVSGQTVASGGESPELPSVPVSGATQIVGTAPPNTDPTTGSAGGPTNGTPSIVPETEICSKSNAEKCDTVAQALGLADMPSFFKMLILAFLAGFAERLVPDILGRISKQAGSQ